jgi:hypothetical protein
MDMWLEDIESFEALCQDEEAKRVVLRLAQMAQAGRVAPFLTEVALAAGLDDELRASVTELALDSSFLLAVEDYVRRTQRLH